MKYRAEYNKILGPEMLKKFTEFIEKTTIIKSHLKNMADEMGVSSTFESQKDKDPFDAITTFDLMLEKVLCRK